MISGMRSWISATSSLASVVMIVKIRIHSPEVGSCQFSHSPPMPKRAAVPHGDGIGLFGPPFDRLPLEEAVDRHNTAASAIGVAEGQQLVHGLHLASIGFRPPFGSSRQWGIRPQRSGSSDTWPV
jgi:hypothetical protein